MANTGMIEVPEPSLITLAIIQFHNFKTIMENSDMYVFDKIAGIYKPDAEKLIRSLIREQYPNANVHTRNEVLADIQDRSFIRRNDFDNHKDKTLLPLKTYLLSVKDFRQIEYSPDNYFTIKFPFDYKKDLGCPKFIKFLKQILPNQPKDIIRVVEGFASGLVPEMKFEKAYMFVGTKAQNGKSTLFNIIAKVIGKDNIANVSIHDLKYERFSRAELIDKSYNIYADVNSKSMRELGIIKMIISGDPMMVEKKGQDGFSYSPRCRLFFSSNQPPIIDEDSNAVYRRFMLIDFQVEFRKHDPFFEDKFEEEYDGIMSLLVRNAAWLFKNRKLRYEQTPEDLRVKWDLKSNPISIFMEECLVRKAGAKLEHGIMYHAYLSFCEKEHYTAEMMNTFTKLMKKKKNQIRRSANEQHWLEWELKDKDKQQEKIIDEEE